MWYKHMARKINHTIEANNQYPNIQDLGLNEVGSDDLQEKYFVYTKSWKFIDWNPDFLPD